MFNGMVYAVDTQRKGVLQWEIGNAKNAVIQSKRMRRRKNVRLVTRNVNSSIPHAMFLTAEVPVRIQGFRR